MTCSLKELRYLILFRTITGCIIIALFCYTMYIKFNNNLNFSILDKYEFNVTCTHESLIMNGYKSDMASKTNTIIITLIIVVTLLLAFWLCSVFGDVSRYNTEKIRLQNINSENKITWNTKISKESPGGYLCFMLNIIFFLTMGMIIICGQFTSRNILNTSDIWITDCNANYIPAIILDINTLKSSECSYNYGLPSYSYLYCVTADEIISNSFKTYNIINKKITGILTVYLITQIILIVMLGANVVNYVDDNDNCALFFISLICPEKQNNNQLRIDTTDNSNDKKITIINEDIHYSDEINMYT
jgi:hypothetical protein